MIKLLRRILCHFNKHTMIPMLSYEEEYKQGYVRGWCPQTCKWCGIETKGLKYPSIPKSKDIVMKFCKDCKHCAWNQTTMFCYSEMAVPCVRPTVNKELSLVSGEYIRDIFYCYGERNPKNPTLDVCGKEGKYFEPM